MEGRGRGTSLWLMPDETSAERLSAVVSSLASRLGTPFFPPHVTLLHGVARAEETILDVTAGLVERFAGQAVSLGPVEGTSEYFRSLYLRVGPAASLRTAHALAAQAFGIPPDPEYLPHLSLVYGRLDSAGRDRIAASVVSEVPATTELTAVEVWRTEGPVGEWRLGRRVPLRAG
jgi:cyclic phosphodiesterase-like protein